MAVETEESAQSQFSGYAIVEIYGHSKAAGYVTTVYFGSACMFRVDTPELQEREFVLKEPTYVVHVWMPAGATVKRPASPARSEFLGPNSIFRMRPCTEEVALRAIEDIYPRPLILLKMPEQPQLVAADLDPAVDPVCGTECVKNAGNSISWNDHVYYFCSSECQEQFELTPEEYATNG